MTISWMDALKIWNNKKGGKWKIPRRESAEYQEVIKIMKHGKKHISKKVEGDGLIEKAGNILDLLINGIRKDMPSKIKETLKQIGNLKIIHLRLAREPIATIFKQIINFLTLGDFEKRIKKLGYDNIYHLFCLIKLNNNKIYRLEKNEVVVLKEVYSMDFPDHMDVSLLGKDLTLNILFEKGIKKIGVEKFFHYSATNANCQLFLNNLLVASGIGNNATNKFIMQDAATLLDNNAIFMKIADLVTDMANANDIIENGRGFKK